jgi:hypothetical protein
MRVAKDQAMRRRRLKRLQVLQKPTGETVLLKLGDGTAGGPPGRDLSIGGANAPAAQDRATARVDFTLRLNTAKLRHVSPRERHYLLRSNLTAPDPAQLWE